MKILEKASAWLFSITDPGKKLRNDRDRLIALVVAVRDQYYKFGVLSPSVEGKVDEVIDEIRGCLPPSAKRKLLEECLKYNDIHLLPPRDYKQLAEQNDIIRMTNERLILSNEDLRLSNERLYNQVTDLQLKQDGFKGTDIV